MLRRSIWELSSLRSLKRIPRQIACQRIEPACLSSRKELSTSVPGGSNGEPQKSKGGIPKVALGSAFVAGAALLAYQSGYLDQFISQEQQGHANPAKIGIDPKDGEQGVGTGGEEHRKLSHDEEQVVHKVETETVSPHAGVEQKVETSADVPNVETRVDIPVVEADQGVDTQTDHEAQSKIHSENQGEIEQISDVKQEKGKMEFSQGTNSEGGLAMGVEDSKTVNEPNGGIQVTRVQTQAAVIPEEGTTERPPGHAITEDTSEGALRKGEEATENLLDAYHLDEKAKESTVTEGSGEQALVNAIEELNDSYITKDGNLVMNFLQAIHEAERRQSELDARAFAEDKRALKEKYEKELRDLRARELMRAEEAAMLDKEIKRERAKAAAAVRAVQEKMDEKLRMELEQKEKEAEMKVKQTLELAKAEVAAGIASEKASQIEKMAEANLHIDALCMAFFARSEEARQIQSVHKLALGALALEDALSKGLPIQQELDALNTHLEGIDKDSLLHLVLSTLPEETRHHGTDTLLQLNQKFNGLKGTLRHHILIPSGGGGILAHAVAQIASWLRFKEVGPSGDGIESIISRVESFLAEGNLAEAADALQEGVKGSKAEEIAGDWLTRARNRAITEQALTVLQSYATCISLTQ